MSEDRGTNAPVEAPTRHGPWPACCACAPVAAIVMNVPVTRASARRAVAILSIDSGLMVVIS
jgi:hypothetical protein